MLSSESDELESDDESDKSPPQENSSEVDSLSCKKIVFFKGCGESILLFTPYNKEWTVGYFDQQTGAPHTIRWLK